MLQVDPCCRATYPMLRRMAPTPEPPIDSIGVSRPTPPPHHNVSDRHDARGGGRRRVTWATERRGLPARTRGGEGPRLRALPRLPDVLPQRRALPTPQSNTPVQHPSPTPTSNTPVQHPSPTPKSNTQVQHPAHLPTHRSSYRSPARRAFGRRATARFGSRRHTPPRSPGSSRCLSGGRRLASRAPSAGRSRHGSCSSTAARATSRSVKRSIRSRLPQSTRTRAAGGHGSVPAIAVARWRVRS